MFAWDEAKRRTKLKSTASIFAMPRRSSEGLLSFAEDTREAYGGFLTLALLHDQVVSVTHMSVVKTSRHFHS